MLLLGRWAFVQPLPSCGCTNQLPYLCGKKSVFQCNETWKQRRSVVCGIWACVSDKVPLLTYYHIRPLQRHEILQFTNICNECFYTSPIWKLLLRPIFFVETFLGLLLLMNRKQEELEQNEVLVAQDKLTGDLVGVVQLSTIPQGTETFQIFSRVQNGKIPYVYNLAVLPQVRRRGIGRSLLLHCEEIVRERWNYRKIGLHSMVGNHGAERLYQSLGYSKKGCDPFWVTFLLIGRRNYWEKEW